MAASFGAGDVHRELTALSVEQEDESAMICFFFLFTLFALCENVARQNVPINRHVMDSLFFYFTLRSKL